MAQFPDVMINHPHCVETTVNEKSATLNDWALPLTDCRSAKRQHKDSCQSHSGPDWGWLRNQENQKGKALFCSFFWVIGAFVMNFFCGCRSRASCAAGSAGGSGRPSSRITSARRTLRAWGRGTRWSSACWTQRPNTCSSSTSWSTTSWGRSAWPPVPRSRPSPTMTSAVYSSTGWNCLSNNSVQRQFSYALVFVWFGFRFFFSSRFSRFTICRQ